MNAFLVSLLFTAGATTWLYTKLQKYSGNNTKQSLIAAGFVGLIILFVFYTIFKLIIGS
jgi:hypothetical protein